ncbi:DUF4935 domain-containing protein [Rhodopseudomonas palustris]|uniref:DUF4935 domain-containing protein n=1 Tax=Rhodopseudomonas palustris TaxID=1076 RepID=A0AAX3DXL9_RHOPL|nr:PIN domain-containing protein [Rhodopseudomonas palustris]UYO39172.1 DUF4935 domain-containing protein [Rhodopseudomonas palustris]
MRTRFPGHYAPTREELSKIWNDCLFVPDTNILLHLFRYGTKTRSQVIKTLEGLKPRVWIPYQVGVEFQKNWREVDQANREAYDKVTSEITAQANKLKAIFNQFTRHQTIDAKEEQERVDAFIFDINERLAKAKASHPSHTEAHTVFCEISDLIGESVGRRPSQDEISKIQQEGEKRYAALIPPGYRDAKKDGANKFGDLLVWKEILEKAKTEGRPIVMISDDIKEDWWHEFRGARIGARPELVEEMRDYADQAFILYSLSHFLKRAAKHLKQNIDSEAIAEIKLDESQLRQASEDNQSFELKIITRYPWNQEAAHSGTKTTSEEALLRERLDFLREEIQRESTRPAPNILRLSTLITDREHASERLEEIRLQDSYKEKALRAIAEALSVAGDKE